MYHMYMTGTGLLVLVLNAMNFDIISYIYIALCARVIKYIVASYLLIHLHAQFDIFFTWLLEYHHLASSQLFVLLKISSNQILKCFMISGRSRNSQ